MEKVVAVLAYGILLSFALFNHETEAFKLPDVRELELEKQYQLFKKPSIKTIKTDHGVIYDCVDFYKQHAFDHPLLKDHGFYPEMRPNSIPKWAKVGTSSQENSKILFDAIKLKDGGCSNGSVPVRRVSKQDFIEIKRFTQQFTRIKPNNAQPQPGVNIAVVQTKASPGTMFYYGVGAEVSIHSVAVGDSQYSAGEMILQNGNDMIRLGWMVNPTLYKDNKTHLFQYLDAGSSHCFNTLCPGFVSARPDLPIDMILEPVSIYGKKTYAINPFVYRDSKSGIWWLQLDDDILGWWPKVIFTGLANPASYIAVGGRTYSPPGTPSPTMGTGNVDARDTSKMAFFSHLFIVDTNEQQVEPQDTEEYTSDKHYHAKDEGHRFKGAKRLVVYGGHED